MPAFLSQLDLKRGDLRLVLTNDLGYKSDAYSVKWTIYDQDSRRVSGYRLPAIKSGVGDYYAPWHACSNNGCHEIVWEIKEQPDCEYITFSQGFYIINSDSFECCGTALSCSGSLPRSGCSTFFIGNLLGRGDISLFLKDNDGIPINAYSVTWQILDSSQCMVTSEKDAVQIVTGEYYANWYVNAIGGDYFVKWNVLETPDSPKESFIFPFTVISPSVSIRTSNGLLALAVYNSHPVCCLSNGIVMMSCRKTPPTVTCNSPCYSDTLSITCPNMPSNYCDFEIPRAVHLSLQSLPSGGSFTNQPVYQIPSRIRLITFYIKYRRNQVGGRSSLKLLWGNGTEEAQSTLIDESFINSTDSSQQNMYLNVYNGPSPIDDNFITFSIEAVVPGGSKTVRLLISESGTQSNPGIAEITLTAST